MSRNIKTQVPGTFTPIAPISSLTLGTLTCRPAPARIAASTENVRLVA